MRALRRVQGVLAAIAFIALSVMPAHAQYGGPNVPPAQVPQAREAFRQSLSPQMVEKTESSLIDVLAAMHERRAAASGVTSPSQDWSDLSSPLVHVSPSGDIQVYVILSEFQDDY